MTDNSPRIAGSADVDPRSVVGTRTVVWHLAQIREGAEVGADCIIGRGAYIGPGVVLGDRCKVQNHALVYEPAVVEDGAFIGPAVVFTNDYFPRSVTPEGALKTGDDWDAVGVTVRTGASIGARAVCVAPSPSGGGRWWRPDRSSPGTCLTSRWWRACPPAGSAGWVTPAYRSRTGATDGSAARRRDARTSNTTALSPKRLASFSTLSTLRAPGSRRPRSAGRSAGRRRAGSCRCSARRARPTPPS